MQLVTVTYGTYHTSTVQQLHTVTCVALTLSKLARAKLIYVLNLLYYLIYLFLQTGTFPHLLILQFQLIV